VLVDRRPVGRTPLAGSIELPAGPHYVSVTHNGRRPYGEEVRLARGEKRTLVADLPGTQQRVLSYVLFGAAAASLVAGGVFAGVALIEQGQAESTIAKSQSANITQAQLDAYAAALSARDGFKLAAYGAFGGAAALALGGAALFFLDTPHPLLGPARFDEKHEKSGGTLEVSAAPIAGPSFVGASVIGRF
jgi:hypothetical protein